MEKIVCLLALYGLGMCFALLGSISVKLMPRLEIDEGKFGSLISVFMFSAVIASLIIGVVIDSIGYKPVAIIGFLFTGLVILLMARGKTYGLVLISCILLGFGAMALNTAGNTLAPVVLFGGKNPAAASNLGNVFFGLGLFLTPLIVSYLFKKISYENAVSILGIIAFIPLIFAIPATYPASQAGFKLSTAFGLLGEPAVLLGAITLFFYISLESSLTNWLPSFGKEIIKKAQSDIDENVVDASAAQLLSFFAIAMMIGRLIASQIPAITTYGAWFIIGAALLSLIIIFLMTITKSVMFSRVCAFLAGLFFAPIFPTTVGVTFAKFNPEIYGSIFGIIFAVGLLGAVTIPKAIGNLARGTSVQKGMRLLIPACIILIVLGFFL